MRQSTEAIKTLIAHYMDTGRVAFYYPRRGIVSVDGMGMPIELAILKMQRIITKENGKDGY